LAGYITSGGNAVNVSDGLFSVMLGSIQTNLASVVQGHDTLYLGITVGTDSEMSPRVQLGSVPFSIWSLSVADDSITAAKIAAGAVGSSEIADGAVGAAEIATDAVGSDEIAAGAVGSSEIAAGAVGTGEIADGSVTQTKLDGTVSIPPVVAYGHQSSPITTVSTACGSGTTPVLDVPVTVSADGMYLIWVSLMTYSDGANGEFQAYLKVDGGTGIGWIKTTHHKSGFGGTEMGSLLTSANLTAGNHVLNLTACQQYGTAHVSGTAIAVMAVNGQ
jgi:hypothetical protein